MVGEGGIMLNIKVLNQFITDRYALYHGDCVEVIQGIPNNSIHFSIYSPPFSSLYTYSNSERDMGNSKTDDEFFTHYSFLAKELFRVMMPGRLIVMHCADIPMMKERDGAIGLKDFPSRLRQTMEDAGFIYHSKVTIWKDPVVEMQRTKALGLLHKQVKKDSAMVRQGLPDYLVIVRKPGDNPERITHTNETFPVDLWQKYASPVWFDIKQNDTLQKESARENNDERHICPLQLGVIERCIELWTSQGDTVFTPYMGIGSEVYQAVKMGRKAIGIELKGSYFNCSINNMKMLELEKQQLSLFDVIG